MKDMGLPRYCQKFIHSTFHVMQTWKRQKRRFKNDSYDVHIPFSEACLCECISEIQESQPNTFSNVNKFEKCFTHEQIEKYISSVYLNLWKIYISSVYLNLWKIYN